MRRNPLLYLPLLVMYMLPLWAVPQAPTQSQATAISGTVADPSGAALVGAKVTLTQANGTLRYETITDASGHYRIASPMEGAYNLTVEANGFHATNAQVRIASDAITTADVRLMVDSASQSVVVTGTPSSAVEEKFDIPLEQFPQAVQVVSHQKIVDSNAISLSDILATVPSATPGPSRESTYQGFAFRIRGFTAYPIYNGVFQNYFFNVDPSALVNIEDVQVIKGPSGVILGQGEVGGAMNITTKRPQHDFAGSVSIIAGSFNQASGSFDVTGPLRPIRNLYFRATGEVERSGSFVNYLPINRQNGNFSASWEPNNRVAVHFVGEWQERDTYRNPGLPVIGTVLPNGVRQISRSAFLGDPTMDGDPGHSNFTATGQLIQAWAPIKLSESWTFTPRISYSTFTGIYSELNLNKVLADLVTVSRTGRYDEERHHYPNEQFDFAGTVNTLGMKHHLILGTQNSLYRVNFFQQNMPSVPSINTLNPTYGNVADGPYPLSTVSFTNYNGWGLYAQDRIDVTTRLNVIAAFREDFYLNHRALAPDFTTPATVTDSNFNHRTFQLGSTYRLNHGFSLFGGYATGFNIMPVVNTLTYSGTALSPETSWQGEGGIRHSEGAFSGNVSFFQIHRTNAVTSDPAHPGYSINNGDYRVRGIEFEESWRAGRGIFLDTGYSYLDGQIVKSNSGNLGFQIADTPKQRGNMFLRYAFAHIPVQVHLGFNYVGNRAFLDTANVVQGPGVLGNQVRLPEYTNVNLGGTYTLGHLRLDANLTNVGDSVYFLKDFGSYDVIPGQPRAFSSRLTYQF